MSQERKKRRAKPSKSNRNKVQLQVTVLVYLYYQKNALNEHLIDVCKTNGQYLKDYVLSDLKSKKWIKSQPLGKKKFFTLLNKL